MEKEIKNRRAELDGMEMPDKARLWRNIQAELKTMEKPLKNGGWRISIGKYWQWSIAASICLIITAALLFRPKNQSGEAEQINLANYYPELAEQKEHYSRLIRQKEQELKLDELEEQNFADLFRELKILEDIHQQTLEDVPRYIDNEQLVRTLIRYYEQKIKILERLSKEVTKQKYHEEKSHERSL